MISLNVETHFSPKSHRSILSSESSRQQVFPAWGRSSVPIHTGWKSPKLLLSIIDLGNQILISPKKPSRVLNEKFNKSVFTGFLSKAHYLQRIFTRNSFYFVFFFRLNPDCAKIMFEVDPHSNSLFILITGPTSAIRILVFCSLLFEDWKIYLSSFSFCRNLEKGKMPKIILHFHKSVHSNSFFYNTTCFNVLAGVAINNQLVDENVSRTLRQAEKSRIEGSSDIHTGNFKNKFFLVIFLWNFLSKTQFFSSFLTDFPISTGLFWQTFCIL